MRCIRVNRSGFLCACGCRLLAHSGSDGIRLGMHSSSQHLHAIGQRLIRRGQCCLRCCVALKRGDQRVQWWPLSNGMPKLSQPACFAVPGFLPKLPFSSAVLAEWHS